MRHHKEMKERVAVTFSAGIPYTVCEGLVADGWKVA